MAATPSVKVIKQMPFKGGVKNWSNRYHFNGGTPSDATHWNTLNDAIVAAEKLIFPSQVTIIECVNYAAGSDVPVNSKTYSQAGTFSIGTLWTPPGEVAALVRWSTTARTTKNHPVYLFNYYHGIPNNPDHAAADFLDNTNRAAIGTYAAHWISGFSDGSITAVRAGPNGVTASGYFVEDKFTHRDFPYTPSA